MSEDHRTQGERMGFREARRKALEFAIQTLIGNGFDQIWGDDAANAAWNDDAYGQTLDKARHAAARAVERLLR